MARPTCVQERTVARAETPKSYYSIGFCGEVLIVIRNIHYWGYEIPWISVFYKGVNFCTTLEYAL